ncbi:MAG: hypothetical protein WCJ31_06285 [Planctomycetia bacterium]
MRLGFRIPLGIATFAAVVATGTAAPPASPRYPVPVRAWFQPTFLDTRPEVYVGMNLITSLVDADVAKRWSGKGVVTLKWAFGPQSEYSQGKPEYYRDQCMPVIDGKPFRFAGVGIDEWNPGSERFAEESKLAAEGYRAARAMWPDNLVVAWVTQPDETFLSLLADGTFDLAIIEGYSFIPDVGGLTLEGIRKRAIAVEKAGLLDRCIVCFGYVAAGADKAGRRMTAADLAALVGAMKEEYPQMPGVAFYGFDDGDPGTPDLVAAAERLGLEVYPSASKPKVDGTGESACR